MDAVKTYVSVVGYGIEGAGVAVIVFGTILATVLFVRQAYRESWETAYHEYRITLGRAIILGLEFLIAGDIIRTVVISHTMESVLTLGLIVLVRTFLSMTITLEIEGRWPWQKKVAGFAPEQSS